MIMTSAARHWWTGVLCILFLAGAETACAHRDPSTCTKPGVTIVFTTFRADGVTEIASTDTVTPCETILYQATLSKPSDPLVCAFEAGRIFIVTPDGVSHDATPASGIPCVGGTSAPCTGLNSVDTQKVTYVVNPANEIMGQLPASDECNGVCDTTTGNCTPKTSTPCTDSDGNTCTTAGCEISPTNAELGVCVQTHMFASNSTPCADIDNNTCTTAGCNGQGVCDQNHLFAANSTPCADADGNACTTAGCNGNGNCDQNHGAKQCPGADECNGGCDKTTG